MKYIVLALLLAALIVESVVVMEANKKLSKSKSEVASLKSKIVELEAQKAAESEAMAKLAKENVQLQKRIQEAAANYTPEPSRTQWRIVQRQPAASIQEPETDWEAVRAFNDSRIASAYEQEARAAERISRRGLRVRTSEVEEFRVPIR